MSGEENGRSNQQVKSLVRDGTPLKERAKVSENYLGYGWFNEFSGQKMFSKCRTGN